MVDEENLRKNRAHPDLITTYYDGVTRPASAGGAELPTASMGASSIHTFAFITVTLTALQPLSAPSQRASQSLSYCYLRHTDLDCPTLSLHQVP
jgi:hypothetical protein